jgi:hypothetical protein
MSASAIGATGVNVNQVWTPYTSTAGVPEVPGPLQTPGTRIINGAGAGDEWICVQAGGSITAGDVVLVTTNSTWVVQSMTNTLAASKRGQMVGVAGGTATSGQQLWMQVSGYTAAVNAATGMTGFTAARSTSTAGRIDDTITGGTTVAIADIVLLATAVVNTAAALLNFPTVGAND